MINTNEKIDLRGINDHITETLGKISVPIIINNSEIYAEFHVVDINFPIPHDELLGKEFLHKNNVMINIRENKIEINNNEMILLKPRTKTIVKIPITDPKVENKNILILKQGVTKDVYCGNVVGKVREGKITVTMVNISTLEEQISENNLARINYEDEFEYNTCPVNNISNDVTQIDNLRG